MIPDAVALQQYVAVAMMVSPASMFVEIEQRSVELFKEDEDKEMAIDAANALVSFQSWVNKNTPHLLNTLPSMVTLGQTASPTLGRFRSMDDSLSRVAEGGQKVSQFLHMALRY